MYESDFMFRYNQAETRRRGVLAPTPGAVRLLHFCYVIEIPPPERGIKIEQEIVLSGEGGGRFQRDKINVHSRRPAETGCSFDRLTHHEMLPTVFCCFFFFFFFLA